jgi:transposase
MPAPRKYSDELRERAVRMVNETLKDNPGMAHKRACHQVGEQLGIPGATLRNWFRGPLKSSPAASESLAVDPAARVAELERENRELRRANAILKTASAFFAAELDRPPTR